MIRHSISLGPVFIALMLLLGCRQASVSTPNTGNNFVLATPTEFTIPQRSTTAVPGSDERLRITIDDITRNQVIVSISFDQQVVVPPTSQSPGAEVRFALEDREYALQLRTLDNALLGEDYAAFVIASPDQVSETEKIERLIQSIASQTDLIFIRNGAEYSAQKAADHLTMKWKAKASKIKSADDFIRMLASRSSMTGKPYLVRLSDGETLEAGDYFRGLLHEPEDH